MNEEEKKVVEHLKKTSKNRTIIPLDDEILIAVNLIEKLQKENEELKNKLLDTLEGQKVIKEETPQYIKENYIPIQQIKDTIDRIDYDIKKTKEIISNNSNIYTSDRRNDYQIVRLKAMNTKSLDIKKRLQELIEEREEK